MGQIILNSHSKWNLKYNMTFNPAREKNADSEYRDLLKSVSPEFL